MPSDNRFLVNLRGTEQYERYLARLAKKVAGDGVRIESHHQLAEHALTVLGIHYGLKVPPRMPPVGKRHKKTPAPAEGGA